MPEIPLTRGLVTIVDDEDYERFRHFKWHATTGKNPYAARCCHIAKKKFFLHNLIMGVTELKREVDHINRQSLDNRRSNLRIATMAANAQNCFHSHNTSGVKGVSWCKVKRKWKMQIGRNAKFQGYFETKEEAAMAYNKRAIELYGKDAYVNVIPADFVIPKRPQGKTASGYRGVYWYKATKRWLVMIGGEHFGYHNDPDIAAMVYNLAAKKLKGPRARLNIIPPSRCL